MTKVEGINELSKTCKEIAKELADMREPMKATGKWLVERAETNFNKRGGLMDSTLWRALKPSTQKDRQSKGYGATKPILVRTGNLQKGFFYKATRSDVVVENKVKYFKYHQLGGRKIPRRVMLSILPETEQYLVYKFAQEISKKLRKWTTT